MKKMKKLQWSFFIMIMCFFVQLSAFSTHAENTAGLVTLDNVHAGLSEIVTMNLYVENNPGFNNATLPLTFDHGLELLNVENAGVLSQYGFGYQKDGENGGSLHWTSEGNLAPNTENGLLLKLTFKVADNVEAGKVLNVTTSSQLFDDSIVRPSASIPVTGTVTIDNYIAGDVNGDGKVNVVDVVMLRKYVVGNRETSINESAADVNDDKLINDTDIDLLRKSIVGGYGINLKHVTPPEKEKYRINYNLYDGDTYLEGVGVENANPTFYSSDERIQLKKLKAEGYIFEGWYDGEGSRANYVEEIPVGSSGNKELYARWTLREYTIKFNSPIKPVDDIKYTINKGATLVEPSLAGYNFLGWSNKDGEVVERIPEGTVGNMTLNANWGARRNQTRPVRKLGDPVIYEDNANNRIMFAYEIGTIENVPLYEIEYLGNKVHGVDYTKTTTTSGTVTNTRAKAIAEIVSKATTDTASWTLSKDWNTVTEKSEAHMSEIDDRYKKLIIDKTNSSGEWNIGENAGDTTTTSDHWDVSGRIGASVDTKLFKVVPLHVDGEIKGNVSSDKNTEKYFNTNQSFSDAYSASHDETTLNELTSRINNSSSNRFSQSIGESTSTSNTHAEMVTNSRESNSSFTYSTEETNISTIQYHNANAPEGYYRVVCAGTIHVFGVVTYDIANQTYGVFSYSVLEDKVRDFLDYSRESAEFNDNEIGVLPFKVPFFVNQYVNSMLGTRQGFEVDDQTGEISKYVGTARHISIPEFISINTGGDNYESVKITGIKDGAFAGTGIESVKISNNITKIPAKAFQNCTSLKTVELSSSVNTIGEDAFAGCTSLDKFVIADSVTTLGVNAFETVKQVTVNANNADVVRSACKSGAKRLVVTIPESGVDLSGSKIEVPASMDYFELQGPKGTGKTYNNFGIVSNAAETVINNIKFTGNTVRALDTTSPKVTLNRVTVEADGWAVALAAENTDLSLYSTVRLSSKTGNALLCKNINLSKASSAVVSKLDVSGNVMICGQIQNEELLTISNGSKTQISKEQFEKYRNDSWGSWEPWSPNKVEATFDKQVETRTVYRYSDKSTSTRTTYGDYGGWSAWSRDAVGGSDTRQVETATVYGYYYFLCPKCGAHMHVYTQCFTWAGGCGAKLMNANSAVVMFDPTPWSNAGLYEFKGTGKYATDSLGGGRWFKWTDSSVPCTGYRYRDRVKNTENVENWSAWSSWSPNVVVASNTRKVETRTEYRYRLRN